VNWSIFGSFLQQFPGDTISMCAVQAGSRGNETSAKRLKWIPLPYDDMNPSQFHIPAEMLRQMKTWLKPSWKCIST